MRKRPVLDVRLTAQVAAAGCAAKLGPGDLRAALTKMLEPLGLTVDVRREVVLVIPRGK